MRLLFLLSFLGSWSIIGSDTSTTVASSPTGQVTNKPTETNTTTAERGTTQGKASKSVASSGSAATTAQSITSQTNPTQTPKKSQNVTDATVPLSQSDRIATTAQNETIIPTLAGSTTTIIGSNHSSTSTTSEVKDSTTEYISTTAKPGTTHAVGKTPSSRVTPSPSSRGGTSASASTSPKPTVGNSTASPSQGLSKITVVTSPPTIASVVTTNAPTESISANASTERTEGSRGETVTSATGKVQNTTMVQAWVKNTTGKMERNATSGAFTDGTGPSENIALRNAVDGPPGAASTTLRPEGNGIISSTAYCVTEPSNQIYSIPIMQTMDCENFVNERGKGVADTVCSGLVKAANLRGLDKCEVQFSLEKEHRGKLNIDVSFKVSDVRMNGVMQKLQEAMTEELNQENARNKQRQQSATELKKLIAMVVTGSLLLLVFLCAIVYRCFQRKSKLKDPYLTEELRTVDNGCHDNPAMDITERESEMEEKINSKATYLENTDGWIVPMDTHMKDEVEEEDTHL